MASDYFQVVLGKVQFAKILLSSRKKTPNVSRSPAAISSPRNDKPPDWMILQPNDRHVPPHLALMNEVQSLRHFASGVLENYMAIVWQNAIVTIKNCTKHIPRCAATTELDIHWPVR